MNSLKKNPLISVIVPIYKVEQYLNACVDSIVNQTYSNLEIILVDDGSPDKCPEICDEYAKHDNRIKVIHQENGGLANARNVGINNACGMYITFVDSDDFVACNYVEQLYKGIIEFDADISIASFYLNKNETDLKNMADSDFFYVLSKEKCIERYTSVNMNPFISAWNKLYKKELFCSILYPKNKLYEDAFTTYKLLDKAKKIVFTPSKLYFYRINPQSILGQSFKEKHLEMVEAFRSGMDYFYQKGENVIAEMFLPPLLMREIYCWWGVKQILKNEYLAQKIINDYRKDCKMLKYRTQFSKLWFFIFKVISFCPWLYIWYRKISPSYMGDRK